MKAKTYLWDVEITDTFGGEANYAWARRFEVVAKTPRGAMRRISNLYGGYWSVDYSTGDMTRYNQHGACVCAFVQLAEDQGE
jgi:hypothetical protein